MIFHHRHEEMRICLFNPIVLKAIQFLLLLISFSSLAQLEKSVYYSHQSHIYFDQDRLKQAEYYADSALSLAIRSAIPDSLANAYRWMYEIHMARKDYQKALQDFKMATVYRDAAETNRKIERENLWESKQVNAARSHRKEVDSLRGDIRIRYEHAAQDRLNALIIFFGILALSFIAIFYFYQKNSQMNRVLEKSRDDVSRLHAFSDKLYTVLSLDLENFIDSDELKVRLKHIIQWVSYQANAKAFYSSEFDCKGLAEEVIGKFQSQILPKQISIEVFIPEGQFAYADRDMISIVLESLMSNAIYFTQSGGRITFFSGKKDDLVTLGIKDSGVGISEEQIQQLFTINKDFHSTTGDYKRNGLGLLLSKDLVERNGGRLYVESMMGQGSTFYFSIPGKKID